MSYSNGFVQILVVLNVGIAAFNFDWLLWRTKPCMLAAVFLVRASVPNDACHHHFSFISH
jgi:hypothetical protein